MDALKYGFPIMSQNTYLSLKTIQTNFWQCDGCLCHYRSSVSPVSEAAAAVELVVLVHAAIVPFVVTSTSSSSSSVEEKWKRIRDLLGGANQSKSDVWLKWQDTYEIAHHKTSISFCISYQCFLKSNSEQQTVSAAWHFVLKNRRKIFWSRWIYWILNFTLLLVEWS